MLGNQLERLVIRIGRRQRTDENPGDLPASDDPAGGRTGASGVALEHRDLQLAYTIGRRGC